MVRARIRFAILTRGRRCGAGVSRFQDGKFARFGPTNGLQDHQVSSIAQNRASQLWLGYLGKLIRSPRDGSAWPRSTSGWITVRESESVTVKCYSRIQTSSAEVRKLLL